MPCAVVEGAEVCGAEGVVLEFLAVVEVTVAGDVVVAERQAEGIVVRALQDSAAAADHRSYVAQVVRDVVLRSVRSSTWVLRQLAVRGHDVGDGKAAVIDEVAAVVVLGRAVLGDRQLVAVCIVDVCHGTRRAPLDGPTVTFPSRFVPLV